MHFKPAVNTKRENKREMTIKLPNLFWQKYLCVSAGNVSGPPGRKIFREPPSILGLCPRLIAMRSKIPTTYCPKVDHSISLHYILVESGWKLAENSVPIKTPNITRLILSATYFLPYKWPYWVRYKWSSMFEMGLIVLRIKKLYFHRFTY